MKQTHREIYTDTVEQALHVDAALMILSQLFPITSTHSIVYTRRHQ